MISGTVFRALSRLTYRYVGRRFFTRLGIYCRRFGNVTKRQVADAAEIRSAENALPPKKKEAGKTGLE